MTSPAITKSPDNQKGKSPTHSAGGAERSASSAEAAEAAEAAAPSAPPPAERFSWMRIFKLADLMMKQGC